MAQVAVTVISGFLGSGKTTLLRRIVRDPRIGPKTAVLINEVGALGLDEGLVAFETRGKNVDMKQLTTGCICCTLRGDLATALIELVQSENGPEQIIIETSGAALASEVSYGVNALGSEIPVYTDAVVTLVDVHNAARAHRESPTLFMNQLRAADLVLLNKADLLPNPMERDALWAWLQPMAPRATWLWTEEAEVAPELILGRGILPGEEGYKREHEHEHAHAHTHDFRAETILCPRPFLRDALEDLLAQFAESIFRIKGVVDVQDIDSSAGHLPTLVQVVGDRIEMDELPADSPLSQSPRRLLFIGLQPDRAELEQALLRVQV